jgi:hypothetical protein
LRAGWTPHLSGLVFDLAQPLQKRHDSASAWALPPFPQPFGVTGRPGISITVPH